MLQESGPLWELRFTLGVKRVYLVFRTEEVRDMRVLGIEENLPDTETDRSLVLE